MGDGGGYRMALTSVAPPTPIVPTSPSFDLAGDLTLLGQRAFYRFDGTEDDLHTFVLDHPGGSQLNGSLRLREPNAFTPTMPFYELAVLASASSSAGDRSASTGEVTLPRSGTYVIEVAGDELYGGARNSHVGGFGVTIVSP